VGKHPPARNHRELIVWQLCARVRTLLWKYTRDGPAARDRRYCDQIRSAARSACNLTSEGFYRHRDGDFLNFLVMARASLGEVDDQVDEGLEIEYFTSDQHAAIKGYMARARAANRGLRESLERAIAKKKARAKPASRSDGRAAGPSDVRTVGPSDRFELIHPRSSSLPRRWA
jgi:four helix bundle protein